MHHFPHPKTLCLTARTPLLHGASSIGHSFSVSFAGFQFSEPAKCCRIQDTLPQNMAPRHTEYFELKQEGHSDTPLLSSLQQIIKSSCERCPPYTQRKGASLSQMTKGHWQETELTGFAEFPQFPKLTSNSLPHRIPPELSINSSLTWHKNTQVQLFLHFLLKVSGSCKTYIKYICLN